MLEYAVDNYTNWELRHLVQWSFPKLSDQLDRLLAIVIFLDMGRTLLVDTIGWKNQYGVPNLPLYYYGESEASMRHILQGIRFKPGHYCFPRAFPKVFEATPTRRLFVKYEDTYPGEHRYVENALS